MRASWYVSSPNLEILLIGTDPGECCPPQHFHDHVSSAEAFLWYPATH